MGSPNPGAGEYEKDKKAGLSTASAARLSLNLSPGYRFVPIDPVRTSHPKESYKNHGRFKDPQLSALSSRVV